jgi:hypothetical protein
VISTDIQFAERGVAKFMKIDVNTADRRVEAAFLGLFDKQRAAYAVAEHEVVRPALAV